MKIAAETNLMHISANTIATLDTLQEYQRLYINNIIGSLDPKIMRARTTKIINCGVEKLSTIWATLENSFSVYVLGAYEAIVIEDDFMATFNWIFESRTVGLNLSVSSSSMQACETAIAKIEENLRAFRVQDDLVFYTVLLTNGSDKLAQTYYQDTLEVAFNHLAVPFVENVDGYIENFLHSNAPLLILQGESGTGKTTFVKYLLQKMQADVMQKRDEFKVSYSFDEEVFFCNDFYSRIIYDDYDVLVLEDINQVLLKNQEDGTLDPINKFLSVTDGLISKYKKIIITTNIESKHHISPLVQRPGRCYDVLEFRNLQREEIDNLCDSCAPELHLQIESLNVSEFYAKRSGLKNSQLLSNRVGF